MGPSRLRTNARPNDALAVSVVAWARVCIATALAGGGSFADDLSDRAEALFLLVGLVWVPWTVIVLFASERPGSKVSLYGGPLGDVLVLFASQLLLPSAAEAALPGHLVVIAFAAYSAGRNFAGALAGLALSLTMIRESVVAADEQVETAVLVMFGVTAMAVVLLLARTTSLHARATARAALLQSSSDTVLDRIADGVVVTDAAGHVLSCNPAAERIIGGAHGGVGVGCEDVLGLRLDERPLRCAGRCALLALSADGHGVEVWRDAGGRRQPLLANAAAVSDDTGAVVEVVHSIRDVSKLKQSEEAKTLFLATASHELKTPLTVIRGFVETLRSLPLDDERRAIALDAVHRRTLELSAIVDRLLLSSRIEAGRAEVADVEVDLVPLLQERVAAMSAARGREISLSIDPNIGAVRGDAAALATVIDHLIDNAIKYSPDGGSVSVRSLAGDPVIVTVTDEGIGMDPDEAAHCFDKFWQAEATDVRRFGGTGIGLYIVRSLVEAMAGRVTVESEKGVGTTFAIELRVAEPAEPIDEQDRRGEATMILEFMRQIGVRERT